MRFISYKANGAMGLGLLNNNRWHGLTEGASGYPGDLLDLIRRGGTALSEAAANLTHAPELELSKVELLPPLSNPEKIICVGLNYHDHSAERGPLH